MLTSRILHLIAITSSFTSCRCFSAMSSFYGLSDRSMSGEVVPMSKFEGKVLCIVNVASACGYTKSNYEQLSQLYDEFPGTLEVLAFPCNQFGAQEPGSHDQICEFVSSKPSFNGADKKFTFFEKADVNGAKAREVYTFLKSSTGGGDIGWNFEIFLVDQKGNPIKRFKSSRSPLANLKPVIQSLI